MEYTHNVPSIEQISFKLTENLIPSHNHLSPSPHHDDSLDYTLSRVSITDMLCQEQNPSNLPPQIDGHCFWKESSMKTTCTGTTQPSSIKKITKTTFRKRMLSSNKQAQKTPLRRRLSHHVMNLSEQFRQTRNSLLPLHSPHPAPYRSKENKSRCLSGGRLSSEKKFQTKELYQLDAIIKGKPLLLQAHSTREKLYMKQLMQKRGSVIHPVQQISSYTPVLTLRKGFRIH